MRGLSHVILDVFTMYVNLCAHVGLMSLSSSSDDNWRRSNTVRVCCQLYKFFVHRILICRLEQVSAGYGLTRERGHDNCYNCFGPFLHLINGSEFKQLINDFWSLYVCITHCKSENSHVHYEVIQVCPIMLLSLGCVIIYWERGPISFKHMSLWYSFLESHLVTPQHSNIGVWLRCVTKLGSPCNLHFHYNNLQMCQ